MKTMPDRHLYKPSILNQIAFWLGSNALAIWDSETTGLAVDADEIVSFAAVDWAGTRIGDENLFIQPRHPERLLSRNNGVSAYDIHGIHPDQLTDQPPFKTAYLAIYDALCHTHWVVWNADYDVALLDNLCLRHQLPLIPRLSVTCAMKLLAPWLGRWNPKYGSFRWTKLTDAAHLYNIDSGRAHNAYGDCIMTRGVLKAVHHELQADAPLANDG